MNKKCNTSFAANKDALIINRPQKAKKAKSLEIDKKSESKSGPISEKRRSRKAVKQQIEEKASK